MYIELRNINDSTIPKNIYLDISIDYDLIDNKINFTTNMYVTRFDDNKNSNSYNLYHRGYYLIDEKELKVAEKNSINFINDFYEGKNILIKNLFEKYILDKIK